MLTNIKAGGTRCIEILCIENKSLVWGQSPQSPEASGSLGADPPTLRRFYSSFTKNTHFLGII